MTSYIFRWILLPVIIVLVVSPGASLAETNLNFVLGGKFLDSDDWPEADSQGALAFLSTFGPRTWPVQVAIDVVASGTSEDSFRISYPGIEIRGQEIVQSTFELDIGVRKMWQAGRARPFVGGGLAMIWGWQEHAILESPPVDIGSPEIIPVPPVMISQEDESSGAWVDGGIFWRLGKRFNLGLEVRYSSAELRFSDRDVQAGGLGLGLILGWGWSGGGASSV